MRAVVDKTSYTASNMKHRWGQTNDVNVQDRVYTRDLCGQRFTMFLGYGSPDRSGQMWRYSLGHIILTITSFASRSGKSQIQFLSDPRCFPCCLVLHPAPQVRVPAGAVRQAHRQVRQVPGWRRQQRRGELPALLRGCESRQQHRLGGWQSGLLQVIASTSDRLVNKHLWGLQVTGDVAWSRGAVARSLQDTLHCVPLAKSPSFCRLSPPSGDSRAVNLTRLSGHL